ncbi:unnamed protein product [Cylicocyclus nassatus]|uniref:VWFA domain-containing protein n=1 Tax=Cylicocyclus nassatus TaxID=53992 RepID=A0AA36GDH8_CYLNA|nr:unnamed protein product [Cylicocyclus nassatus]
MIVRKVVIGSSCKLLLLLFAHINAESDTFSKFCLMPSYCGSGTLENTAKCTVVYPRESKDAGEAEDFCHSASPYTLTSSKYGKNTTCVHERGYVCEDGEQELYDNCLIMVEPRGDKFSNKLCPEGYQLHVLGGRDEAKWIAIIFRQYKATWIGNSGDNARFLKPKLHPNAKKRGLETTKGKPIFIRLAQGARDGTKRGCAYYGTEDMQMPYLCSRKAEPYEETHLNLTEIFVELGIPFIVIPNKNGNERVYANFGLLFAVEAEQFEAKMKNLHIACYLLPKGFVASHDDFLNANEFTRTMDKFKDLSFRVSKGRSAAFSMKAEKCEKEKLFMSNRKHWSYYDKKGDRFEFKPEHWKNTYPDNMCADLPRITALMLKTGYIDIPAMGRRPVLCSTGGPEEPNRPLRKGESCNRAAKYNPKTKQCECNFPETDGRLQNPKVYGNYPPGIICLSCKESKEKKSIVFVFDRSGTINVTGVHQELRFMKEVAKNIKGSRTGAVVQDNNPRVTLNMGQWDTQALFNFVQEAERERYEVLSAWTVIGRAMFLGRKMLEVQ